MGCVLQNSPKSEPKEQFSIGRSSTLANLHQGGSQNSSSSLKHRQLA